MQIANSLEVVYQNEAVSATQSRDESFACYSVRRLFTGFIREALIAW